MNYKLEFKKPIPYHLLRADSVTSIRTTGPAAVSYRCTAVPCMPAINTTQNTSKFYSDYYKRNAELALPHFPDQIPP